MELQTRSANLCVAGTRADSFMASLLVALGGLYEALGQTAEAEHYFALASERGVEHYQGRPG